MPRTEIRMVATVLSILQTKILSALLVTTVSTVRVSCIYQFAVLRRPTATLKVRQSLRIILAIK